MHLFAVGDTGFLAEFEHAPDVLRLLAVIERDRAAGRAPALEDVVPAERTLLVRFSPRTADVAGIRSWLEQAGRVEPELVPGVPGQLAGEATVPEGLEIGVRYDGEDLDDVGRLTGLGPGGVIAAHTGTEWTVAFTGFAPGFGYLAGGDPRLRVARLAVPRTRVPAGAVALAGGYSGVYPRSSPGGWQLIGTTSAPVWDPGRTPPALLRPGIRVRFVALR